MYKLLPEKERKKVSREYALRRGAVIAAGLTFVFLFGVVGLLPSYILVRARVSEALIRTQTVTPGETQDERRELLSWLADANRKLALLSPDLDTDRPTSVFESLLANGDGISIVYLGWKKSDQGTAVTLSGVALDRQSLLRFEDRLNSSGQFEAETFPVSQLAQERDLEFYITLSLVETELETRRP